MEYTDHSLPPMAHAKARPKDYATYWGGFVAGASSALGSVFVQAYPAAPLVWRSYGSLQADAEAITSDGRHLAIEFKHYRPR